VKIFRDLIDLIYPPRCLICQAFLETKKAGETDRELHLCEGCSSSFIQITSPLCPVCGRPFAAGTESDHVCEDCLRKRPFFEKTRAPYLYEGSLLNAIHEFKYAEKTYLATPLGLILSSFAKTWLHDHRNLLVMPVPLHPKRLRERGFNQSLLLAEKVAMALDAGLDFSSLKRIKYTQPQTGLGSEERKKNVRKAFGVSNPHAVKGRDVVLVDDVATTGSTLNECARSLRRAGCRRVFCLVLARTSTA
jgi:ComF family protein